MFTRDLNKIRIIHVERLLLSTREDHAMVSSAREEVHKLVPQNFHNSCSNEIKFLENNHSADNRYFVLV